MGSRHIFLFKTFSPTLQAIAVATTTVLAVIGCGDDDKTHDGMVVGGTDDPSCMSCYFSAVDNPEITSNDLLYDHGDYREYAQRGEVPYPRRPPDIVWQYNNFDLRFKAWGGDSKKGAVTNYELVPRPTANGSWEPSQGNYVRMPWSVRGIELGYSPLNATATHYNLDYSSKDAPPLPVRVSLDPNTILVPVQVIRVLPPKQSIYYEEMIPETYEKWKNFFDGPLPFVERSTASSPASGYRVTRYQETPNYEIFTRADDIFKQCGIQFRMIDCQQSTRGCPDLHVQEDKYVAPERCSAESVVDFPEVTRNWNEAAKLPGVDPGLPIVVLMVRPDGHNCPYGDVLDVAKDGRATFSTRTREALTPAHELGHVLGLPDVADCKGAKGLMCAKTAESGPQLTGAECKVVRNKAAQYARRKWGVNITP